MKVARLLEPRRFEIREEPVPEPGPGEVLIQSQAVGICASDIHYYAEGAIGDARVTAPFILGHEPMGTILGVGAEVSKNLVGKRVAIEPGIPCFECELCLKGDQNLCPNVRFFGSPPIEGAFRERFTHPAGLVEEVPDDFSPSDGALLEPLGVAIHAVDLSKAKVASSATVVGCGTIGLCTVAVLKAAGVTRILAVDPLGYRTQIAQKVGATETFIGSAEDALSEMLKATGGRGTDLVFEAAGYASAHAPSMEMACIGGKVVIIGISSEDRVSYKESAARRKGLTIYMARRSRRALRRGIDLVAAGRIDLSPLVTHRFPLDRIQEAFETVSGYKDGAVKAVIEI